MTDSLASLRQLLATNTAVRVPGAPPAVAAPAVAPPPAHLSQTLTTPTKVAATVANVPKKKFDLMSMLLLSGGVLLCIYVYYKYFRKVGAKAAPSRQMPPQPRAPVAHSAERRPPQPAAAKRVQFDDSSNKGPTIEEIRDDSDLVASSGEHAPSPQDTNSPQAGPKTADSKDPNFQALKPEERADPDL